MDSVRLSGVQNLPSYARDDLQNQDTEQNIETSIPVGNRSVISCSPHGRTDPEHVPACEHKDWIVIFRGDLKVIF